MAGKPYTKDEVDYIVNNYNGNNYTEVAAHLGRNPGALMEKADRLRKAGFNVTLGNRWTKEETEKLHDLWGSITAKQIAKLVGKSPDCVKLKAYREIGTVGEHKEYLTAADIAEILGVTAGVVYRWLDLGLITQWDRKSGRNKQHVPKHTYHVVVQEALCRFLNKYPYLYRIEDITDTFYKNYARTYASNGIWLSVFDASRATGISQTMIRFYIRKGLLKATCLDLRSNSKYFIERSNLRLFVQQADISRFNTLNPEFRKECGV